MCYDINTSLDAVECNVVFHMFIVTHHRYLDSIGDDIITVHLAIPGLDILFPWSFLTVGEPCRTFN